MSSHETYLKVFTGLFISVTLQVTTLHEGVNVLKDMLAAIAQGTIIVLTVITILKNLKNDKEKSNSSNG